MLKVITILERLFTSKARIKILNLFLLNPKDEYYVRQVEELTALPYSAVKRELENLHLLGLLNVRLNGNRTYYSTNSDHYLFEDLQNVFLKSFGIGDRLREALGDNDIEVAFIFGSYATGEEDRDSDIDLLVVGNIKSINLHQRIHAIEENTHRSINYVLMTKKELVKKLKERDHFVTSVTRDPKVFVVGDKHKLDEILQTEIL